MRKHLPALTKPDCAPETIPALLDGMACTDCGCDVEIPALVDPELPNSGSTSGGVDKAYVDKAVAAEALIRAGGDTTLQSELDALKLALATKPVYKAPVVAVSSDQSGKSFEVGESIVFGYTLAYTANDAGAVTYQGFLLNGTIPVQGQSTTQSAVMSTTPVTVQAVVNYGQGPIKNLVYPDGSQGDPYPTGSIQAGSVNSAVLSARGYYAMFYGSVAAAVNSSAGVRALNRQLTIAGKTFTIQSGSVNKIFQFWLPLGTTLVNVADQDASGAILNFDSASLAVADAAGNLVAGTLYTLAPAIPYSTNHRLLVTTN